MAFRVSTFFGFLALCIPIVTAIQRSRHHQEIAHRARGDVDIHKRGLSFSGARFTFYDVGLGACGQYNNPDDFIVALSTQNFGSGYPGPYCFEHITIQYTTDTGETKTTTAVIMDECMGCPSGGLDFSTGLFSFFDNESKGVIYGNWWINDDSSGGGGQTTSSWTPPTTTWEPPTTTSTPDYTPTTSSTPDYTPPSTSSTPTYTPPPATSTSSTSSTSPSSSASSTSSSSSWLTVPTGVVSPPSTNDPQNIFLINDALVEIGTLLSTAQ